MFSKKLFNGGVLLGILIIITASLYINRDNKVDKHFNYHYSKGRVLEVTEEKIEPHDLYPGRVTGRQELKVLITQGKYKGNTYEISNSISAERNIIAHPGMKAVFTLREQGKDLGVWLYANQSDTWIYILGGIFFGVILLLSGKKGLESMLALAFTTTVVFFVLIPIIFNGGSPILWSILLSVVITAVSMVLIGEFDRKTLSAIGGTISGIVVAGIMAYTFGSFAKLSNVYLDYGDQLMYLSSQYPVRIDGLIFTGILIASLGAVMDVAMSISSAASELSQGPDMDEKRLFISVMNIGRDIMGTMTNTLILAFTGGALNLLLMIWGFRMGYNQVMNMPIFATEVIQALSGSIGIILTVPFTAALSTKLFKRSLER